MGCDACRKAHATPRAEADHDAVLLLAICDDCIESTIDIEAAIWSVSGIVGNVETWMRLVVQKVPHIEKLQKTRPAVITAGQVAYVLARR